MKNKIKKILLLGMTAMFTAGAAGTAVISCPVWADEAEQNSETAEEPKAEDAAVEYYSQHFFLICCIFCFFDFRIKHYTLKRLIQFSKFLFLYSFLSEFIIAAVQLHGIGFLSNAHIHTVKCINIYQCRNLQDQIKWFQFQKTVH